MKKSRRTVRLALAFVLAAITGTAVALVLARETKTPLRTAASAPSTRPPSGKQLDNRILLSHRESLRLVAWAKALRACLAQRGIDVGEPVAYAKQIDLKLHSAGSPAQLMPTITGCGDSLGEPPRRSSLQFRPGKLVLYLPKQCLLDPKVRAKGA
jgi:hypothetical protein